MIEGPPGVGLAKSPRGLRPTLGPIRNPYREIVSIAYGSLEGFMPWSEVESVLREGRLLSGWLFPSSDAERASCGHGVLWRGRFLWPGDAVAVIGAERLGICR